MTTKKQIFYFIIQSTFLDCLSDCYNETAVKQTGHPNKQAEPATYLTILKTFKNQPNLFDLVITDQTMPDMTGADIARR